MEKVSTMKTAFLLITIIFVSSGSALSDDDSSSLLIVARALSSKYVMLEGDLPEKKKDGHVYMGVVYRTKLKILDVISGHEKRKKITVDLIASHKENLFNKGEIVVLLVPNEQEGYDAIGWDYLKKYACLPAKLIGEHNLGADFKDSKKIGRNQCVRTS